MNAPKEDIKWFELFFDIIFVVGLSKLISEITSHIDNLTFEGIIRTLLMFFILFNLWIRVVMLENKIKIIERYLQQKIKKVAYKIPVFIQFILTLYLIYFYHFEREDDYRIFLFIFLLISLSNAFLYVFKPVKVFIVAFIFILSLIGTNYLIVLTLFSAYVLYETYYTYRHLRTISNSIFRKSKLRPTIEEEFTEADNCILEYSNFRNKIYIPHIIERLGIIMIVFIAEYCLAAMSSLDHSESIREFVINSTLFFSLIIMFYYNYFSSIEHIDEKLLNENDKRRKYIKGKRSIYIIVMYFISVSSLAFVIKNFYGDVKFSVLAIGVFGFCIFEIADIILFLMYDDIKPGKMPLFIITKAVSILIPIISLVLVLESDSFSQYIVMISINISFALNIIIGKRFTTVDYMIH